jgi:hypothetical protein
VTHIRHDRCVRSDPGSTPYRNRFLRGIALKLDRYIQTINVVVILARKKHNVLTDEDVILDEGVIDIAPNTHPNIIAERCSFVINYDSVMKDDIRADRR